jgi:hypothetical protein
LAQEDSDQDGKVSATDASWQSLRVWVDANQDGITDAGELKTLDDLGISSLSLAAQRGTEIDNGNLLGLISSYETVDGQQHEMVDVWFSKDISADDVLAAAPTDLLAALNEPEASVRQAPAADQGSSSVVPSPIRLEEPNTTPLW